MERILVKCAATDLAIQWFLWNAASIFQTKMFHDLAGPGTFLSTLLSSRWNGTSSLGHKIPLFTTWGLSVRLFLFIRLIKEGQYRHFTQVHNNRRRFFPYWTIEGIWIFITLLLAVILNLQKEDTPLYIQNVAGWTIWAFGFMVEAIADHQRWNFKSNSINAQDKFSCHGLWAYSQHPNYLGELLQWIGLFISASSVMNEIEYISVFSLVIMWVFHAQTSGIPILEKEAMKKWGHDPAYLEYVNNTPSVWPFRF
ncbi:uncharacterized protein [Hemitrygon akajei]|uniref:uncharacterized protein isoform X1 n=1 Tax=Hemitrygon akajei TaxID=2704970 RepID=UPI003BFA2DB5